MISRRAKNLMGNPSAIMTGHLACCEDPFSSENPRGYLNFGIAENRLVDDLALEVLGRQTNPRQEQVHYAPLQGLDILREAFAGFAANFLNAPEISADKVVAQSGLSSVCESLAFALFDEGDEIVLPAPYYTGFKVDFQGRFKAKLAPARMKLSNGAFEHDIKSVQAAAGPKTKALLLTSPHNPTGAVLSRSFMREAVDFCQERGIHLISDEIYALSVHDRREHASLLEAAGDYENVHILYGMAKDFGLAGIKTGFYYGRNPECLEAMQASSYFHPVSTHTQALVADFLNDAAAVESFVDEANLRTSKALGRLRELLPELKLFQPQAGMFFMADFRECLNGRDDGEFYRFLLDELKINMIPGTEMGMDMPGFFRVCYARPERELREFAARLRRAFFQ